MESDDSVNQLTCENYNMKSNTVENTLKHTTSLTSKKEFKLNKDSNEKRHLQNKSKLLKNPPESSSHSYNSHNFQFISNESVKYPNLTTSSYLNKDKETQVILSTQHVKETEVNQIISKTLSQSVKLRYKQTTGIKINIC